MAPTVDRAVSAHLAAHLASRHQVVSLAEALALGLTMAQVKYRTRSGLWVGVQRRVYAPAGVVLSPEGSTLAACLACAPTARASHESAGWLWGFLEHPPYRPSIVVPVGLRPTLVDVDVHRSRHPPLRSSHVRRLVPVTPPVRTVVDLAAILPAASLDRAIDIGVAHKVLRHGELVEAIGRWSQQGRTGVPQLRAALERRGVLNPPAPSVLESRTYRLLREWGITPLGREVSILPGVRVDVLLASRLVLEVDGYAYHSSPEAKAADSRRRNALRAAGYAVIEADWVTVMRHPEELRTEVERALARAAGASTKSARA